MTKFAAAAWNRGRAGEGIVHRSYSSLDSCSLSALPNPNWKLLFGQRDGAMQVCRVAEGWQPGSQLGEREWQNAFDLCRVDGDRRGADALAEELLGEQPTERVPDDDGRLVEPGDDLGVMGGDVVDAEVGHDVGVRPSLLDRRRLVGPPGCAGLVAG
jgi:hypothetical protein